jgi:hypothetical protein
MPVPVGLGRLDQGVDLAGRQVLAGPKLGVRGLVGELADASLGDSALGLVDLELETLGKELFKPVITRSTAR